MTDSSQGLKPITHPPRSSQFRQLVTQNVNCTVDISLQASLEQVYDGCQTGGGARNGCPTEEVRRRSLFANFGISVRVGIQEYQCFRKRAPEQVQVPGPLLHFRISGTFQSCRASLTLLCRLMILRGGGGPCTWWAQCIVL